MRSTELNFTQFKENKPVFLTSHYSALSKIESRLLWPVSGGTLACGARWSVRGKHDEVCLRMTARWENMCSLILNTGKYTQRHRLTHGHANPALNLFIYLPQPQLSDIALSPTENTPTRIAGSKWGMRERGREDDERSVGRQLFKHGNGRLSILWSLLGPAAARPTLLAAHRNIKMN